MIYNSSLFIWCDLFIVAGFYGISFAVHMSIYQLYVCPSAHIFVSKDNLNEFYLNGFPPNLVCINIVEIWFWIADGQIL